MKFWTVALAGLLATTLLTAAAMAQPPGGEGNRPGQGFGRGPGLGRGPGGGGEFRPPSHPLMLALDTDKDGELSADEIKNAPTALRTLDKDEDGKLSGEELRPQFARPGGGGGFRGPGRGGEGGGGEFRGPQAGPQAGPRGGFGGGAGGPARGGAAGGNVADRIMGFDANNDKKVSKDELPAPMQRNFERADTNGDGGIDRKEAETIAERFRAAAGGGRGPGAGRGPGGGGERPQRPQRPE